MEKKEFYEAVERFVIEVGEETARKKSTRAFGISQPTFNHWATHKSCPHRLMRPVVVEQIKRWLND